MIPVESLLQLKVPDQTDGLCPLRLLGEDSNPREAGCLEFLVVFPSPHGSSVLLATLGLNF